MLPFIHFQAVSAKLVHSNFPGTPRQPQAHKLKETHISIYCTAMGTHPATFSENALLSETENTLAGQIAAQENEDEMPATRKKKFRL